MTSELIATCKTLEEDLREYKLWANLVPRSTWGRSLYNLLPKPEWDKIRRAAYAHYGYECAICGRGNVTLYGHEDWKYRYEEALQVLVGVLSLCNLCHMCNHLGFASIQARRGNLDFDELIRHWCRVNSATEEDFEEHMETAAELWRNRNKFDWKPVDSKGNAISEETTAETILDDLWTEEM